MRKFKEVGARESLQFCGLATLKLPTNTYGNVDNTEYKLYECRKFEGDKNLD